MLFLDLFAGSGQMGLEAVSRGAQYAVFVEKYIKSRCMRGGQYPLYQVYKRNKNYIIRMFYQL